MSSAAINGQQAWANILGHEFGLQIQLQLSLLAKLPRERLLAAIKDALREIETAEAIGPLIDPSAWVGGERFDNAKNYRSILRRLFDLVSVLPDLSARSAEEAECLQS